MFSGFPTEITGVAIPMLIPKTTSGSLSVVVRRTIMSRSGRIKTILASFPLTLMSESISMAWKTDKTIPVDRITPEHLDSFVSTTTLRRTIISRGVMVPPSIAMNTNVASILSPLTGFATWREVFQDFAWYFGLVSNIVLNCTLGNQVGEGVFDSELHPARDTESLDNDSTVRAGTDVQHRSHESAGVSECQ